MCHYCDGGTYYVLSLNVFFCLFIFPSLQFFNSSRKIFKKSYKKLDSGYDF